MPIRVASEAWPRPGLAEPRSASIAGFGNGTSFINIKGKIVMIETSRYKGLVLGSFLAPETDMIFGDGVGASLVGTELQGQQRQPKCNGPDESLCQS